MFSLVDAINQGDTDMTTYELTVIESDEQSAWQRFALSEKWGQTEPHYVDGEQLGKNVVVVEIHPEAAVRFERELERDPSVLSYRERV